MNDKETVETLAGELIQQLADAEHASWSRWMKYLFSMCSYVNADTHLEGYLIPQALVDRWKRQADTPYVELSEREQQSDLEEVLKILPAIDLYVNGLTRLAVEQAR